MPNRFLGFTARDLQRAGSISTSASAEAFADVRADRLRGIPHLPDVQQPPRMSVYQLDDPIRRPLGSVAHVEITVRHDASMVRRSSRCATSSLRLSSFLIDRPLDRRSAPRQSALLAVWPSALLAVRPLALLRRLASRACRRLASRALRHLRPPALAPPGSRALGRSSWRPLPPCPTLLSPQPA